MVKDPEASRGRGVRSGGARVLTHRGVRSVAHDSRGTRWTFGHPIGQTAAMDGDVERLAERLELVGGGGSVWVGGDEQGPAALPDEMTGELRG